MSQSMTSSCSDMMCCRFDIHWRQQIVTAVPVITWLLASQPTSSTRP